MDKVYVVRWGPAAGDDYSTQVFTTKAKMLAFVDKLKEGQLEVMNMNTATTSRSDVVELNYEVHFVSVDVAPEDVSEDALEQTDLLNYSELICIGEPPDNQIWRNGTEQHQS